MFEKIKGLFKKSQTEFDDNADFDVDKKLNKKVLFKVKKKNIYDNVDLDKTVNFDDKTNFDLDKELNKKVKFKSKKNVKEDNGVFDDSADFDLDEKSNKKAKDKKTRVKDDRDGDFSFSDHDEKGPFKFEFKWWMLIPLVLVFAAVMAVITNNAISAAKGNEVSQVAISSLPDKLVYYVGEEPSYTGLIITTTLNNGTSFTEGPEACTFSGFNSEFAELEQRITVTYGEHTFVFTVDIKERPRPVATLKSISLKTLPKTEYKVGNALSVSGGIILVEYNDGSTREIQLKYGHISGFSTEVAGNFTITVLVEEGGILATCTYNITVTE